MVRDYQISQRRACGLIGVDPKTVRRERPPDHAEIREEMSEIAATRRRFGYRRVGVMLERKGHIMNHKKLYRLYRKEGLSVRRRRGRKRARGSRTSMPVPLRPNDRWSMDLVADTFGASRRLCILAIYDDACRENLCLVGDTRISGVRVARELGTLVRLYGKPACIVSDNGTEFTSRAILKWASEKRVEWHYDYNNIRPPAKPEKLVETFLGDDRFLMVSPNAFNGLGVGTTQLYNEPVVYNRKRHGKFTLDGRVYDFRMRPSVPKRLSKEVLLVDLLHNLRPAAGRQIGSASARARAGEGNEPFASRQGRPGLWLRAG